MKRYTIFTLITLVIFSLVISCATTQKVKVADVEPEAVAKEAVVEVPEKPVAEEVVVEPVAKEAVVEVPEEPVAKVVVEDEPEPLETWKVLNFNLTQNGKPVYLPEVYLNHSVSVSVFDNEYAELTVVGTDFKIALTYKLTESGLVVTPVYYENVPVELQDDFLSLGVKLPVNYYFTGELLDDGMAVMEAEALDYELSVMWTQVM